MSVAALVLGILSLIFGGVLGIILGVLALVFAGVALSKHIGRRGLAIAGLVCAIIGTVWNIIYTLLVVLNIINLIN